MIVYNLLIALMAESFSIISIIVRPLTLVLNLLPHESTVRHSCKCGDVSKNNLAASTHF